MSPHLILVLALSILTVPPTTLAEAETMYVTDVLRLSLRSQPDASSERVGVLESGQKLEIVNTSGEWAMVRSSDDKTGWVRMRFLMPEATNAQKLAVLKKKHQILVLQATDLRKENTALKAELAQLRQDLEKNSEELNKVEESYSSLKSGSADYLKLKTEHQEAVTKLSEYTARVETMENELAKFELQRTVRWFLSGAGVLLLGLIIGFNAKRQRRRLL